jgi:hypothetical protein
MIVSRLKASDVMLCIMVDRYKMLPRNLPSCIFRVEGEGTFKTSPHICMLHDISKNCNIIIHLVSEILKCV